MQEIRWRTLTEDQTRLGASVRLKKDLLRIIQDQITRSNFHSILLSSMSYNSHHCNPEDPLCSRAVMIPANLRRELARQTQSGWAWVASHTTLGLALQYLATSWCIYALLSGTVNLIITLRQLSGERYPGVQLNCFHILLSTFRHLDHAYNPLNMLRSSLKREIQRLISETDELNLKIRELSAKVSTQEIRIRELEIQSLNQSLKFLPRNTNTRHNASYEWMDIGTAGSLLHNFSYQNDLTADYVSLDGVNKPRSVSSRDLSSLASQKSAAQAVRWASQVASQPTASQATKQPGPARPRRLTLKFPPHLPRSQQGSSLRLNAQSISNIEDENN